MMVIMMGLCTNKYMKTAVLYFVRVCCCAWSLGGGCAFSHGQLRASNCRTRYPAKNTFLGLTVVCAAKISCDQSLCRCPCLRFAFSYFFVVIARVLCTPLPL